MVSGMIQLVIGNKQLSSWSLRPWILLKHLGLPFEEIRLPLDTPRFREEIGRYSPTGRVPALLDGAVRVWESIAICEYLNEATQGIAWPADPAARSTARAISAEMHAGFQALRTAWTLKAASTGLRVPLDAAARADLLRIESIWSECRRQYEARGPWLFVCADRAAFQHLRCAAQRRRARLLRVRAARPVASRVDPGCRTGAR